MVLVSRRDLGTFSTSIKSVVGTGILSLPAAVNALGITGGVIGMLFIALISWCESLKTAKAAAVGL